MLWVATGAQVTQASKELYGSIQQLLDNFQALDLLYHDVRKLILQRFICAIPRGRANDIKDVKPQQDVPYAFAVSRSGSREGDQFLFVQKLHYYTIIFGGDSSRMIPTSIFCLHGGKSLEARALVKKLFGKLHFDTVLQ